MAKSGGKQTRNIAGTNKIGKAGLYNGSAKCSKPHHFSPCIYHGQCQYTQANEYHFGGARTMQDTKVSCTYHIYIYIYILDFHLLPLIMSRSLRLLTNYDL